MRRLLGALSAGLVVLAGCGGSPGAAGGSRPAPAGEGGGQLTGTLTVFAAASLTDVLTVLGNRLEQANPGLDVQFSFAGSSSLATQLSQGAPADVFAPADESSMERVREVGLAGEPRVFAQNRVMLAVPPDDPAGIAPPGSAAGIPSLADLLPEDVTLAVCAVQVPCGVAAAEVLDAAGITGAPDTYEQDVRAVLTKVQLGEVDAGVVYLSDVHAATGSIRAFAFTEAEQAANRYPIATLADAPNPEAARAFVDLVTSGEGRQALADAGFLAP